MTYQSSLRFTTPSDLGADSNIKLFSPNPDTWLNGEMIPRELGVPIGQGLLLIASGQEDGHDTVQAISRSYLWRNAETSFDLRGYSGSPLLLVKDGANGDSSSIGDILDFQNYQFANVDFRTQTRRDGSNGTETDYIYGSFTLPDEIKSSRIITSTT